VQVQHIYNFSFGDPLSPEPARGVTPAALPHVEECTLFQGVKSSWGINTAENKILLNQEDNQAPQPTISHLQNDLKTPSLLYFWTIILLGLGKFLIFTFILEYQLKLSRNLVSPWLLCLLTCLQDYGYCVLRTKYQYSIEKPQKSTQRLEKEIISDNKSLQGGNLLLPHLNVQAQYDSK
jgi:hypothetical protein